MALLDVLFGGGKPRCKRCGCSWYEHHDHSHKPMREERIVCPFGDCDAWQGDDQ